MTTGQEKWRTPIGEGKSWKIRAGDKHTAAITCLEQGTNCILYLIAHNGRILWKKPLSSEAHISFWSNETRMGVGGELLDTHTGTIIPYKRLPKDQLPGKPWGFWGGGSIVNTEGKWQHVAPWFGDKTWLVDCKVLTYTDMRLCRVHFDSLHKTVACDEGKKP